MYIDQNCIYYDCQLWHLFELQYVLADTTAHCCRLNGWGRLCTDSHQQGCKCECPVPKGTYSTALQHPPGSSPENPTLSLPSWQAISVYSLLPCRIVWKPQARLNLLVSYLFILSPFFAGCSHVHCCHHVLSSSKSKN